LRLSPPYEVLAPRPIVMSPAFSTPGASDEGRDRGVVFGNGVLTARVRRKNAPRERISMFTSCRRRDTMAAPSWFLVL